MNNLCFHNILHIAEFCNETAFYLTKKSLYKHRPVNVTNKYFNKPPEYRNIWFNTIHNKTQIRFRGDLFHWNANPENMNLLSELSYVNLNLYISSPYLFSVIIGFLKKIDTLKLTWVGLWENKYFDIELNLFLRVKKFF